MKGNIIKVGYVVLEGDVSLNEDFFFLKLVV